MHALYGLWMRNTVDSAEAGMAYLELFWTFFKIGLFGFGGGAAMLSLIQIETVVHHHWISADEFTDMVAISQVTPGPIGINSATYAGYLATHSVWGSVVATSAVVLPSLIIMLIIATMIAKFKENKWIQRVMSVLRPTIVGLIAAAALLLITEESFGEGYGDWIAWVILAAAFVMTKWLKVSPILMIVGAAVLGIVLY